MLVFLVSGYAIGFMSCVVLRVTEATVAMEKDGHLKEILESGPWKWDWAVSLRYRPRICGTARLIHVLPLKQQRNCIVI